MDIKKLLLDSIKANKIFTFKYITYYLNCNELNLYLSNFLEKYGRLPISFIKIIYDKTGTLSDKVFENLIPCFSYMSDFMRLLIRSRGYLNDTTIMKILDTSFYQEVLNYAMMHGVILELNEKVYDYALMSNYNAFKKIKYLDSLNAKRGENVCERAASLGRVSMLEYLHKTGSPLSKNVCTASARSSLECLKYAHENNCPWDEETCAVAAYYGRIIALKYAHKNGCDLGPMSFETSIILGKLNSMRYIYEHVPNIQLTESMMMLAIVNDRSECMKYLFENGCPIKSFEFLRKAAELKNNKKCIEYLDSLQ